LKVLARAATHESNAVVEQSIVQIETVLEANCEAARELFIDDSASGVLAELVESLMRALRIFHGSNAEIQAVCCRCLGLVGAVDPSRIKFKEKREAISNLDPFTERGSSIIFSCRVIEKYLVPALLSTSNSKKLAPISFAIQEMLGFIGFTQEIAEEAEPFYALRSSQREAQEKVGQSDRQQLRSLWSKFPESVREAVKPFFKSKYVVANTPETNVEYPIFHSSAGYKQWIVSWCLDLAGKSRGNYARPVFIMCSKVVEIGDVNLARYLLPYLVLNVLVYGEENWRADIQMELTAVLSDLANAQTTIDVEKDQLGAQTQTIFTLMDHLTTWVRQRRVEASRRRIAKAKRVGKFVTAEDDDEQDLPRQSVESLLRVVPQALMAEASFRCKAFARALLHCEQNIRARRGASTDDGLQDLISFMHKIYSYLDEPDGMEGIMTLFQSPTLDQQILDHESSGRWSQAHSCYELAIQSDPETVLVHARGAASKTRLNSYAIEASWRLAHWDVAEELIGKEHSYRFEAEVGKLILDMKKGDFVLYKLHKGRIYDQIIAQLAAESAESYSRCYGSMLNLHALYDVEEAARLVQKGINGGPKIGSNVDAEIGKLWLQSAKLMRRGGYSQSAFGATLHAGRLLAPPNAVVEKAKWLINNRQPHLAITELKEADKLPNVEDSLLRSKISLLLARTLDETGVGTSSSIISILRGVIHSQPNLEKGYFLLGSYYNKLLDNEKSTANGSSSNPNQYNMAYDVCKNYAKSIAHGSKHVSQTLPKLLTLWLELGAAVTGGSKNATPEEKTVIIFNNVDKLMQRLTEKVPPYLFLTVLPQLISRICHGNSRVQRILEMILIKLVINFPHQTLWQLVSMSRSRYRERASRCSSIFLKVKSDPAGGGKHGIDQLIQEALRLTDELLAVCNHVIPAKTTTMSVSRDFKSLKNFNHLQMIVPTQSALTVVLPSTNSPHTKQYNPFPRNVATILGFQDEIEIMNSLQKPRKLTVAGSDGRDHIFLLKPKDDLRKDARLMEFNGLINKLLKKDPETRKRNLYIRTYAVVPLNEECGIIEWVENTIGFRNIVVKSYRSKNNHYNHQNVKALLDARNGRSQADIFTRDILPKCARVLFSAISFPGSTLIDIARVRFPPVFHEWFLETFPEPT
ncbi:serine/threonine-protein kinase M1, partial [Cladochytrium tenue]